MHVLGIAAGADSRGISDKVAVVHRSSIFNGPDIVGFGKAQIGIHGRCRQGLARVVLKLIITVRSLDNIPYDLAVIGQELTVDRRHVDACTVVGIARTEIVFGHGLSSVFIDNDNLIAVIQNVRQKELAAPCSTDTDTIHVDVFFYDGITAGGASRCMRSVAVVDVSVAVARCGNNLLRYDGITADRAVGAFRQAGLGAGGRNCCVNDLRVSHCGDLSRFKGVAAGTGTLFLTLFRAGGRFRLRPFAVVVAQCIYVGVHIAVTAFAGVGGVALIRAGGLGHYRLIAMRMRNVRAVPHCCGIAIPGRTCPAFFALDEIECQVGKIYISFE